MHHLNQWVWVTGASAGIGKELALAYHREGAHVILSSRNKEQLEAVGKLCEGSGEVRIVTLDLSQERTIQSAFEEVRTFTNTIDILINNGGISQRSDACDTSAEVTRRIMEINFFGTVSLTLKVLPLMLEKRAGQIVVMSSVAGKLGAPLRSSYSASKHALQGYFESLDFEMRPQGIQVTMICPGYIQTAISMHALTGSGQIHNQMDENQVNGMLPSLLAQKILQSVRNKAHEEYFGGKEILAIYLKRYCPAIYRSVMKKQQKKVQGYR